VEKSVTDWQLFELINQGLAHPLLDGLMIGLSFVGLAILPAIAVILLLRPGQRRVGFSVLTALAISFLAALAFQYLALRPRPEAARLLIELPNFPSYPSGHASLAFAFAAAIGLSYRRWLWPALLLAGLIALSRVYLGVHYPSDVLAGAVLGASIGAASFGLFKVQPEWGWLLWPQVAVAIVISLMAYLGLLPIYLLTWPLADKVLHFILFGAIVFWLNLWLGGRLLKVGWLVVPLAIALPLTIALLEEGLQSLSPLRSADPLDLASDLAGMLFFWGLSRKFLQTTKKTAVQNATIY
jgi:undecaprenyl-diphosphatase